MILCHLQYPTLKTGGANDGGIHVAEYGAAFQCGLDGL
jgi:hypothetical protein